MTITKFHGAQHGIELPLVPVRALPVDEWEAIRTKCIDRGHERFRIQQKHHHFEYSAMVSGRDVKEDDIHVCDLASAIKPTRANYPALRYAAK